MSQSKEKFYWPTIVDLSEAINASNKGVWAAAIVAALTFAFATISLFVSTGLGGLNAWSYIDAVVFGLIAWGIYRRSRICSVLGLLLFIVEKVLQLAETGLGMIGMGIAGFFVVLFVIGIKGTFAYHKFKTPTSTPKYETTITQRIVKVGYKFILGKHM